MSLVLSDTARNSMVAALTAHMNSGTVQFQNVSSVEVATMTFGATAFASPSAGVATANSIANDTNADGGTVTKAIFRNSSATEIFRGTVTADGGGGDITGPSAVIGIGETVSLDSLTITQPAS